MKNTVKRDPSFGQLISATNDTHLKAARRLLELAIKAGLLDAPYVDVDRKHRGSALNYDLYDAKDGVALYQCRHTVCTKYGNTPTKDYVLLRRKGRGVELEWLGGSTVEYPVVSIHPSYPPVANDSATCRIARGR